MSSRLKCTRLSQVVLRDTLASWCRLRGDYSFSSSLSTAMPLRRTKALPPISVFVSFVVRVVGCEIRNRRAQVFVSLFEFLDAEF